MYFYIISDCLTKTISRIFGAGNDFIFQRYLAYSYSSTVVKWHERISSIIIKWQLSGEGLILKLLRIFSYNLICTEICQKLHVYLVGEIILNINTLQNKIMISIFSFKKVWDSVLFKVSKVKEKKRS